MSGGDHLRSEEKRKGVLDFDTRVKVYLDKRFFGEEVYLGKGKISGRIVYGDFADYAVEMRGANGEKIFVGTTCLNPGVRCFRIRVLKEKKNGKKHKGKRN